MKYISFMKKDLIYELSPWLNDVMGNPENLKIDGPPQEKEVVKQLHEQWINKNKLELLQELTQTYGEKSVCSALTKITQTNTSAWWKHLANESHDNNFDEFYKLLWADLVSQGFEFTYQKQDNRIIFNVTKCPIADLAHQLKAEKWLFSLHCASDEPAICSFNPQIKFHRDKTLIEGDNHCNHCYILPPGTSQ